jgi:ribonucleoside-diphosphate reductase alpha chain
MMVMRVHQFLKVFQWEMWDLKESDLSGMHNWKQLRKDIIKYGVRNSLVT